jgi:phosphate transport system substrate-binding protein
MNAMRSSILIGLFLLGACAQAPAPKTASQPLDIQPELRIVWIPVTEDLEELGSFSRMGLPLDVFASIQTGEESLVSKVASKATLMTITRGPDERSSSSVMLTVSRDDVEALILVRDLVRRHLASFYLAAGPRSGGAPSGSKEKSLQLRQMLARLGYELPEHRPTPLPVEAPVAKSVPASVPAPAPVAAPKAEKEASVEPPLPDRLPEGRLLVDGSSTVYLMAKVARDEFMRRYPGVTIDLMGVNPGESPSGTGGGFKKFCFGETEISDASRFIKDEEIRKCAANNVSFLELPLAYDGLSVVVSRANTWAQHLTLAELKAIWAQDSKVQTWRDVRPEFPPVPIKLFCPGRDSGTFDFFNEAVFGKAATPRPDAVASEDDEILVRGIASAAGGIGYFGLAYYIEHKDQLKLLAIDGGKGPILPANDTVLDGSYSPFSRPLFIYVNTKSLARAEVHAYVRYFLRESSRLAQAVGYIPLPADLRRLSHERFAKTIEGSMRGIGQPAGTLRAMMAKP